MTKPYNLWKKNLKYIPGGNGLISKRPERFSLKKWPIYYKKCEKIYIWDLNDKKYTDMAQMGIGTCPLGYANKKIDNSVKEVIKNGINSTLNSPEEYTLAKKILKYEKFADKVKFARGGGEAMSIAVRLARSSSKHDQIAFSGYHGWHDWYLATNLKNKNSLNQHLLPGLLPKGVPRYLYKETYTESNKDAYSFTDLPVTAACMKIRAPSRWHGILLVLQNLVNCTKCFHGTTCPYCLLTGVSMETTDIGFRTRPVTDVV